MVGSLKLVGEGKWPETRIAEILAAADRTLCGPVAPACGLYLDKVDYDADAEQPLPAPARAARSPDRLSD